MGTRKLNGLSIQDSSPSLARLLQRMWLSPVVNRHLDDVIHLEAWSISNTRNELQLRGNSGRASGRTVFKHRSRTRTEDEDEDAGGEISSEVEFEEGREAKISEVRVIV
ncbi:hypothetical protein QLX08_009793 [Tetragonisca angustula]|uniref:Uncharacterized protein n=1 Tax=Tetragonisca angustula TaxID=166442 RepID=A0AAW0ZF65_9HYME